MQRTCASTSISTDVYDDRHVEVVEEGSVQARPDDDGAARENNRSLEPDDGEGAWERKDQNLDYVDGEKGVGRMVEEVGGDDEEEEGKMAEAADDRVNILASLARRSRCSKKTVDTSCLILRTQSITLPQTQQMY